QNLEGNRRNVEDLNNLFGDESTKHSCYSNNEILTLYESAYESHKYPKFLPFVIMFLLGAILWEFIRKNFIESASQKLGEIWEAIYQQFAGNSLFLGIAVKRYNEKLIEDYQLLPIIFTGNQLKLPMKDIYVPLKIANSSDRELLNIKSMIESHRRLMITGEPGSGKTLLCKYLSLNYAEGGFNYLTDKPIPIILELYRVSDNELTIEKLQNAIVNWSMGVTRSHGSSIGFHSSNTRSNEFNNTHRSNFIANVRCSNSIIECPIATRNNIFSNTVGLTWN
ncbi:MAG: hypothetical protein QNJ37_14150, partial [Crocosphaera sp.]|nr:hypothetical protein [Crocosphaera sp.]